MKYILVIWICSFVNNQCSPPIEINKVFNDWNDCVHEAYNHSSNFLEKQSLDDINKLKLATKFICKETNSV